MSINIPDDGPTPTRPPRASDRLTVKPLGGLWRVAGAKPAVGLPHPKSPTQRVPSRWFTTLEDAVDWAASFVRMWRLRHPAEVAQWQWEERSR